MSRIKIFLLILILAALIIIFVQNREPITLGLLCGYGSSFCLYQTPSLPLAIWIGLFILLGAIANLLVQTLNRYGYNNSKQKYSLDDDLYRGDRDLTNSRRGNSSASTVEMQDSVVQNKFPDTTSYEVKQEPQNVERSGSTYSYKYREAGDRPKKKLDLTKKTSLESEKDSFSTPEEDEDWI